MEMEVAQKLREYCESSCSEALHLLDFCYREDNGQTLKLLTAQLPHWGYQNCLSLAVMANHKPFLAHPCGTNLRVLAALVFPPAALALAYKAPHVHSRKEESHSDESTTYDTISTCRTDRLEGNSAGSMMSLHLHKLFKTATSRARSGHVLSGDELDELVENGVGTSKKVTIMTSKKNSGLYGSTDMLVEQPHSLSALAKMRAFYSAPITKFWSWCIAFVVFLMLSSYVLLIETPVNPTFIEYATLAYIVVYTVEHIRKVLEYLSVHPLLGPYIQMAAKMVVSMCYIIVLLLVTLMAFGVSRQAITYPHEKWNWLLVRNIFYKPYFMLYGEVYAGEIDTCGDEVIACVYCGGVVIPDVYRIPSIGGLLGTNCVPGGWIPPVLMTIFLLVANILLINMLIAIFNNIFNDTNIRSHEVWLFQRYGQVGLKRFPNLIRLYLSAEELRELHDFEEDCMDELTRRRIRKEKGGAEDSWLNALEMTELTSQRVNELLQENCSLKSRLCDMEARLDLILRTQAEFVDMYSRRRKQSKTGSSRASTQSLPEADDNRLRRITIAAPEISPLSINDQSLLSPVADRNKTASPLISHLRMDQTLRKYDEARYQHSSIGRRARLNSSSFSLSQDMRDMDRQEAWMLNRKDFSRRAKY
ncbi:unnamed protein product [Heligmosomoides polygyrus]|uniref:Uncharacterized protein n=1 Tax=Heligmosomoides polygyrus TaxID=6339 RepID=A0A3P7YFX5_HELPZ|nr:unnamed protein product [Heligmosomoides polygyrus]